MKPLLAFLSAVFLAALCPSVLGVVDPLLVEAQAGKKEKKEEKKGEKKAKKAAKKQEQTYEFDTLGVLGAPAKTSPDFYEFTYAVVEGKKKASKKAWIKIDGESRLLRDRLAALTEFKEGDTVHVFTKPVEREAGGPSVGVKVYHMQASRVVIGGKEVTVNEAYNDPKDREFQWCEGKVEKAGQVLTVSYEDASYKLMLEKGAGILMREDGDMKRDVRKGNRVLVKGSAISEKPEGEEERPVFKTAKLLVVENRLSRLYDALIP